MAPGIEIDTAKLASTDPVSSTMHAQATIILEQSIEKFTPEEQQSFLFALSRMLNVRPDEIRILRIEPGSTRLILELPRESAERLLSYYMEGDLKILDFNIKSVKIHAVETLQQLLVADYIKTEKSMLKKEFDKLVKKDEAAWERLVKEWGGYIMTIALKMAQGSYDLAQDISQSVFLELLGCLDTLEEPSKFKGFLARITIRTAWKFMEGIKTRKEISIEQTTDYEKKSALDRPPEYYRKIIRREIVSYLGMLSEQQQLVIALFYFEGLSLKESAELIGTSPNVVAVQLHFARRKLKDLIGDKGKEWLSWFS